MLPQLIPRKGKQPPGVALVIVLAFVVLLTGLIVAFFSRAISEQQISGSSVSQTKVEGFAQGAAAAIIGDLKQEIVAGSVSATVSPAPGTGLDLIYTPKTIPASIPAVSGFTPTYLGTSPKLENDGLNNLVKLSKPGPFYPAAAPYATTPAAPNRASSILTTTPSLNGRAISLARWNKPLLLPAASLTSLAPASAAFTAPNWVLVARNGTNPGSSMVAAAVGTGGINDASPGNQNFVVGRYAYAIYNEGGLLDANVAGYPTAADAYPASNPGSYPKYPTRKVALAYADLTVPVPVNSASPNGPTQSLLTAAQVNALVGWRNYASSQPVSGSFPSFAPAPTPGAVPMFTGFDRSILSDMGGLMTVRNTAPYHAQSDRMFAGRQQLISLVMQGLSSGTPTAALQNALQYLGTFNRSLDQPSYYPNPNRRFVVGPAANSVNSYQQPSSGLPGGNSAYGLDSNSDPYKSFNPAFRSIRVTAAFTRNDGSTALVGEPLVKRRFALNRLAWITRNGPSASNMSDQAVRQAIRSLGGDPANVNDPVYKYVAQGTPQNILAYFNLAWVPANSGATGHWIYRSTNSGTYAAPSPGAIATLGQVAAQGKREPDFFELLKAGICSGSLAKGCTHLGTYDRQLVYDTSVNYQIMQIGANIIDAADADSFPTHLVFNDGANNNSFWGQEDLPYFLSSAQTDVLVTPANPAPASDAPQSPAVALNGSSTSTTSGLTATFTVPVVWNPYSPSASPAASGLAPANLRISMTFAPSQGYTTGASYARYSYYSDSGGVRTIQPTSNIPSMNVGSFDADTGSIVNLVAPGVPNTALYFKNSSTLYRDPTPLWIPDPTGAGTALSIDAQNIMVGLGGYAQTGIVEAGSGNKYVGFFTGNDAIRWNMPLPPATPTTTYTANGYSSARSDQPITYCLEYQNGSGAWTAYQQYSTGDQRSTPTNTLSWYKAGDGASNALTQWKLRTASSIGWDPRTPRWGMMWDVFQTDFLDSAKTMIASPKATAAQGGANGTHAGPTTCGWFNANDSGYTYIGQVGQNVSNTSEANYLIYQDADGVIRRAMGGAVTSYGSGTALGLPMATAYNQPVNVASRPVMLNRPLQSVAELGYVFSGTPWKNLDFSFPETGDNALLDVFCIRENVTPNALVAGKVDLNTRQYPVLQAILAGADRNEIPDSTYPEIPLTAGTGSEASLLAQALVMRTTGKGTTVTTQQPLSNIADLVGRPTVANVPASNGQPYDGFANDLLKYNNTGPNTYDPTKPVNSLVQRYRESAMRALSNNGMAGTWNLLIDVVAQTGRYPNNLSAGGNTLSNFVVEGEKRYWLHVAIDRQTCTVIDEQFEPVNE